MATPCSAFLQSHVRRVVVGPSAGFRLLPGMTIGAWSVLDEGLRLPASTVYRVTAVDPQRPQSATMTVYETPALALNSYATRLRGIAAVLSTVEHPGVIDVLDVGLTADGRPYTVVEAGEGASLSQWLAAGQAMEITDKLAMLRAICAPLIAAHDVGVVHGSLAPEHIVFVDGPGRSVRLLDWGFERAVLDEAWRAGIEHPARERRSRAPEEGLGVVSPQTDVYSFGLVANMLVVGTKPFADDAVAAGGANESREVDPRSHLAAIPPALETLLTSLLAADPRERPSIRETSQALTEIEWELASPLEAVPLHPDEERARPPARRSRAPEVAVAATALAIVFAMLTPSLLEPETTGRVAATSALAASPQRAIVTTSSAAATLTPRATVATPATAPPPTPARSPAPHAATVRHPVALAPAKPSRVITSVVSTSPGTDTAKATARRAQVRSRSESLDDGQMASVKAELLLRYQRIGRDLILLQRQRGTEAVTPLWNELRALKIQPALATPTTRATTTARLDALSAKIDRNAAITPSKACLESPLADGCR